jgi:hypothetical protein
MTKGRHYSACRCRDSEETPTFHEDFPGLPLRAAPELRQSNTGRSIGVVHTAYGLDDEFIVD